MTIGFGNIPVEVVEYIRKVFGEANHEASRALTQHPSMHEESLDHAFIGKLNASPPVFFAASQAGVEIETHWLGGRRMYERWEIADIAVVILLRTRGKLIARKVALLQTKRLYSDELSGVELEESDYRIGIGRLIDRDDDVVTLSSQRTFTFKPTSLYGALKARSEQILNIEKYFELRDIPIFYKFYNPMIMPYQTKYPMSSTDHLPEVNELGCRVIPATDVHGVANQKKKGQAPSFKDMTFKRFDSGDPKSVHGWRAETFIADEVLKCRQGALFGASTDVNLRAMLYGRAAPIASAITITIDLGRPD